MHLQHHVLSIIIMLLNWSLIFGYSIDAKQIWFQTLMGFASQPSVNSEYSTVQYSSVGRYRMHCCSVANACKTFIKLLNIALGSSPTKRVHQTFHQPFSFGSIFVLRVPSSLFVLRVVLRPSGRNVSMVYPRDSPQRQTAKSRERAPGEREQPYAV